MLWERDGAGERYELDPAKTVNTVMIRHAVAPQPRATVIGKARQCG
jgi:hypothetical protein